MSIILNEKILEWITLEPQSTDMPPKILQGSGLSNSLGMKPSLRTNLSFQVDCFSKINFSKVKKRKILF